MRVTKRLMAALLACLMLLSLLPVPAYAADDGRIALLAVAQDGYVIEPEYIGYRSGDTVKDVLKNSGHTFSGIDSGFITAVDGRTDNYSLHYDGDGYALDASAKGLTAIWFTTNANQSYGENLLHLAERMAAYNTSTNGLKDYAAAKAALFRQCRDAAVNRDDPWTERILRDCACPVYDYGLHGGRLLAEDMDLSPTGVRFTAREGGIACPVSVSIPGLFTVYNALAALSMARLSGISLPDAAGALAKVPAVPGRMEPVTAPGLGCRIFIDFAHTPEALAKALETLRPMTPGRVIAVFGCGGCRDKGKRPLMGAAAGQYADLTVLTSDNPRTEDPLAIIRDILPGLSGPHLVIPDRREAIFRALDLARPGDTVILCGKGHETTQETGSQWLPMDERQIIAEYINGS